MRRSSGAPNTINLSKNVVQVLIVEAQRCLDLQRAQAKAAQQAASKHRKRINATVALHLSKFKLIAYLLKPNAGNLEQPKQAIATLDEPAPIIYLLVD